MRSEAWGYRKEIDGHQSINAPAVRLAEGIVEKLGPALTEHLKERGSVVILNNVYITVNYASGGGATVNVSVKQ